MSRDVLTMNQAQQIDFDTIKIHSLPVYDIEDYDLFDEKDIEKYIKDCERICRNSFEYKKFVKFLKENLDMNACAVMENARPIKMHSYGGTNIKIHIHHDPLTLYEIVKIVFTKRMKNHENMDEQLTCKEVMLLHYNLLVGLIPLCETVHELVHNQYLFIPTQAVFGFYRDFINMYDPYIEIELKNKIDRIEAASAQYIGDDRYILDVHLLYTDMDGIRTLPKYEDVKDFLLQRIDDIDNDRPVPHENPTTIQVCPDGKPPWSIKIA